MLNMPSDIKGLSSGADEISTALSAAPQARQVLVFFPYKSYLYCS